MSEKAERTRIGVTMTKVYLDGLDKLVEEGIYLDRGRAIMRGIRMLFEAHDVEPFAKKEPPKEG